MRFDDMVRGGCRLCNSSDDKTRTMTVYDDIQHCVVECNIVRDTAAFRLSLSNHQQPLNKHQYYILVLLAK